MSNKNQQQMNQAQRNRFASLPSRTNNIQKQKQEAEQVEQSQMQQTPIPQTIILESNRLTSRQEDINAEGYSTNHRWTTEYSNGGIQIRKGDEIRINSAYISSIGVGDLIEWDIREDSSTQDNKANWIFSYYGCNDHLNDKRSGYNMKEVANSENSKFGGNGRFNFDCDNSPCPLIRITPKSTIGTPTPIFGGEMTGERLSWFQDPYLKCRFYGETFTIKTPVLDDHYEFILHPKLHLTDTGDHLAYATAIQCKRYTGNNVIETIDPRAIMGIGQTLNFKSQPEAYITANPNTNFHDKNVNDWVFTIQDFRVAHADSGISGANVLIVDSLNNLTGLNFPMTETITTTAKLLIGNLPSICSSSETFANEYPHTALSTIVWTGKTADNYIEVGDKFKQYEFCGVSFDNIDHTQGNLCVQSIDSQTENKVLEVQVASSNQTATKSKIKLHMISLIEPTPANHRSDQQVIQFQFEPNSVEHSLMKASGGGANALSVFTKIIGTNCVVFDFFGGGAISGREIAVCFLYTQTTPTNYSNFNYDTTNNIIQLNNVRRNQNSETLLNLLSTGQPITFNTTINNSEDYYLIITPNFFTDFTASFTHEESKQFRGETWDWSTKLASGINGQKRIDYYGYIKDNNNELTATNLTTTNNRALSHSQLQSNSFNFENPLDNSNIDRPMKYAGYINNDSTNIEVKHYAQHELKIEENYSSPSDIATALTEQTHYVGKAINKNGVEVPNSESNGLIQNAYYIPVWTSAGDLTDSSVVGNTNPDQNKENALTGKLQGVLQSNSFLLRYKMKNSPVAHYSKTDEATYAEDGDYDIYFKTKNTYINKPIAFQDITKPLLKLNGNDDASAGHEFSLTADLDQTKTSTLELVNATQVQGNLQFAKCFTSKSSAQNPVINGFPIEYAPDSFISQYCGSNNVSISWDDTNSRFKIDFLHQPAVSKFEPSAEGIVQEGGQLSTTIYYPAPVGRNNNLYKMPRTRVGGVNIENWSSQDFSNITTPQQVRNLCNLDSSVDLSTEWFITDTTLDTNKPTAQNNYNDIGNRFWNKLGFLNSQLYKNVVGSSYDSNSNRYIPNGTTDNLVDIADALITAEEPAENTPFFFINEKFDGSKTEPATNQFGSIGGLNFNSHLSGYGIPNTTGVPITFISNETLSNLNIDAVNADHPDPKKNPPVIRPKFSEYLSTYNPDRERNTGYSFTTEPNSMTAGQLPIKTEFPYFYVMSDIIETDFNISVNKGTGLNCLGVMSKLNAEGDFFFQYQAPQSFFATKDKLISSITTELRTPTLGIPQALSPYSSVIYQISRYAPTPIQVAPPVWIEQKMVFDQMKNLLQNIATSLAPAIPITADQQIGDSMGGQVQGEFPDAPLQINTADQRDIYQSMINSISGRITEPLPAVQQALPSLRGIQNPLQLTDEPAPELSEEQQLEYELAVHAIRGRTRPNTPPPNLIRPFPVNLGGLRHTNRNTLAQLVDNVPLNEIYANTETETIAGSFGGDSVDSLATIQPDPVRTRDKPDEDIPSMLGDSVAQSSVPPLYRGRSLPSYATGSIAPTYSSAMTEVSEQTIAERIQEQRRKEDDEMD